MVLANCGWVAPTLLNPLKNQKGGNNMRLSKEELMRELEEVLVKEQLQLFNERLELQRRFSYGRKEP